MPFVLRRLGLLLGSLVLASVLVFLLLRLLPGDMAQVIAGTQATPEAVANLRHQLGTDRPLVTQYFDWIGGVVTGDFGRSPLSGASIGAELTEKLSVTVPLVIGAIVLAIVLAVPGGILAAALHRRRSGTVISVVSQLGIAVPTLWLGLVLAVLFAVHLRWLPAQGFPIDGWSDSSRAVRSLVLPAVTLALAEGAVLLRYVRSATLEVLHQDWLRTARAKGLTRTRALLRHGVRNAALSVVSVLGLQIATLLVGAIVVETVFNLPGAGQLLVRDVGNRDLVAVQSEVLIVSAAVLVVGFTIDVAHRLIDPRLRRAS
nr:ABC transporter permease [Cryptosporangium aurantiacum]